MWSTPRALAPDRGSPGMVVRHRGTSGPGPSRPGQLVDPADPRTRSWVAWDSLSTTHALGPRYILPRSARRHRGPSDWSRLARESWSTRGNSDTGANHPGELVDPTGPPTRAQVVQDTWSTPRELAPLPESPRTAGRTHGPSELGTSHPGMFVKPADLRTPELVTLDSWSTTREHGPRSEMPRTAGPPA